MPEGANVNFVARTGASAPRDPDLGAGRRERDARLRLGGGRVGGVVAARSGRGRGADRRQTRSGETLVVDFDRAEGGLTAIRLTGDARILFEGEIRWEEWS